MSTREAWMRRLGPLYGGAVALVHSTPWRWPDAIADEPRSSGWVVALGAPIGAAAWLVAALALGIGLPVGVAAVLAVAALAAASAMLVERGLAERLEQWFGGRASGAAFDASSRSGGGRASSAALDAAALSGGGRASGAAIDAAALSGSGRAPGAVFDAAALSGGGRASGAAFDAAALSGGALRPRGLGAPAIVALVLVTALRLAALASVRSERWFGVLVATALLGRFAAVFLQAIGEPIRDDHAARSLVAAPPPAWLTAALGAATAAVCIVALGGKAGLAALALSAAVAFGLGIDAQRRDGGLSAPVVATAAAAAEILALLAASM